MYKKQVILLFTIMLGVVDVQAANGFFGGIDPKSSPSVFAYGWSGMRIGTLVGAAIGGIQAMDQREKLDSSGEARRIATGAVYGLLGGTVMGLGIGFHDLSSGQTGAGAVILRDMWYGGALGLVVGAAVGGLNYSKTKEGRDIGQGIAWGYVGGTIVGFAFGIIEAPQIASNPLDERRTRIRLALIPDSVGMPSPGVSFQRRF